jgi:hypothetical protein
MMEVGGERVVESWKKAIGEGGKGNLCESESFSCQTVVFPV